jgi:hypothetical protein
MELGLVVAKTQPQEQNSAGRSLDLQEPKARLCDGMKRAHQWQHNKELHTKIKKASTGTWRSNQNTQIHRQQTKTDAEGKTETAHTVSRCERIALTEKDELEENLSDLQDEIKSKHAIGKLS